MIYAFKIIYTYYSWYMYLKLYGIIGCYYWNLSSAISPAIRIPLPRRQSTINPLCAIYYLGWATLTKVHVKYRFMTRSAVLISRLKNTVIWFIVREKYCFDWKIKLKKINYKPNKQGRPSSLHGSIYSAALDRMDRLKQRTSLTNPFISRYERIHGIRAVRFFFPSIPTNRDTHIP
jgi:hypothetical protein